MASYDVGGLGATGELGRRRVFGQQRRRRPHEQVWLGHGPILDLGTDTVRAWVLTSRMTQTTAPAPALAERDAWRALGTLVIGFFMILVDMTIVSVATPAIIDDLRAGVNEVVWVTSAYLLAYAVPVLITGRLGDRFGPRRLYLIGLVVFTLASLWCGLSGSIGMLIVARSVQGVGASMMTPQTMAVITRIFPQASRGKAMALWGATAGVAMLVGPLLGGVLVDALGWEWIFFVNVPIGVIGFLLALRTVPTLETHPHKFDWPGVALSGVAMFCIVFAIQEGHQQSWAAWIWIMLASGLVVLAAFLWWQARNTGEPLLPLGLFRDRNFSLSNVAITAMGFSVIGMSLPFMIYAQAVRGMSPTTSALLMVPMALVSMVLARPVGGLTDRVHPRILMGFGFATIVVSFVWLSIAMTPDSPTVELLGAMAVMGLGSSFIWAPNAATATRNLPMQQAGAGAGVYNATRQVGSVLGSAGIALLMDSRLAAHGLSSAGNPNTGVDIFPAAIADAFATAMAQSLYLPTAGLVVGFVAVLFYEAPEHQGFGS
ncbi:DHA2 family efflux MFS transporter permease subunit [Nocardioides sp.]|uniref:DHA2 family efflux MFS transporter permease subunit n=1 Tax=Nocardioides sp. TaxID=35761 RepID=UPI0039E26ED1